MSDPSDLPQTEPTPTLLSWLRTAESRLLAAGLESPKALVEFWAAHVLRSSRTEVRLRSLNLLSPTLQQTLESGLARLLQQEPLQYITGETSFWGRNFHCDPRALIPRQETEELVEKVLQQISGLNRTIRILDVGTGTGCIAISLALECAGATVTAVDISAEALALARTNAHRLGARVDFQLADLLELKNGTEATGMSAGDRPAPPYDLIVSNPPYISESDWQILAESVRDREPRLALTPGPLGVEISARLMPQMARSLVPGGTFWLEIGDRQGPGLAALAQSHGFVGVRVERDLSGRNRFLTGIKSDAC